MQSAGAIPYMTVSLMKPNSNTMMPWIPSGFTLRMWVLLIEAGESHKLKGVGRFSRNGNCLKLIRPKFR
jgi:hypothetical protein